MERDYLARPVRIRVFTDIEAEAGMTDDERRHIAAFDNLSEETLNRLGAMNERNDAIVSHYLDNKAKYGKTLVFATCIDHACLLKDKFCANDAKAEYAASRRPDGDESCPQLSADCRHHSVAARCSRQCLAAGTCSRARRRPVMT